MHGGDIYRNKIKYDFSINVNPLGMPIACKQELSRLGDSCSVYPDSLADALAKELATKLSVSCENLVFSNGAAELIYKLAEITRLNCGESFKALTLAPTFTEYEKAVNAYGGVMEYYELDKTCCYEIKEDILDKVSFEHKLVFICNPNNPTGELMDKDILSRLANKCKELNILLVVDECFIQFVNDEDEQSMVRYTSDNPNIFVLQAFTKIYGMAGLRLGYGITSNDEIIASIKTTSQPWVTSTLAQELGVLALKDEEYITKTREIINKEKNYIADELSKLGIRDVFAGDANYIMFKADKTLYGELLKEGIMLRRLGDMVGLDDSFFRAGIRLHEENEILINAIKQSMK